MREMTSVSRTLEERLPWTGAITSREKEMMQEDMNIILKAKF